AGVVAAVRPGRTAKEIFLSPSGLQHGLEDVLVILEGDHKPIPELPPATQPVHLRPLPPADGAPAGELSPGRSGGPETDLDREVDRMRRIGEDQKHVFGERGRGAPDYNRVPDPAAHPAAAPPVAPKSPAPAGSPAASPPSAAPRP